jgi:glutamyl-Q tRNA(Asp) synthetase
MRDTGADHSCVCHRLITRFAPSPTGPLHLGHAYSAMLAHDMAREAGGTFLLRIEDIDRARCRPEWEQAILDDLRWLGLDWPERILRQSDNAASYAAALGTIAAAGLVYPCSCSRGDIRAAMSAPQEGAAPAGPDGLIYPGTCRGRTMSSYRPGDALRLDTARALQAVDIRRLGYDETGPIAAGHRHVDQTSLIDGIGDVVLGRKEDGAAAYHLAAVVDDAAQGVTHVIRGDDLAAATPVHVLLQAVLDLPTPVYHHHRLIRDEHGKRLAKRDDARAIALFRAQGYTPADLRRLTGC